MLGRRNASKPLQVPVHWPQWRSTPIRWTALRTLKGSFHKKKTMTGQETNSIFSSASEWSQLWVNCLVFVWTICCFRAAICTLQQPLEVVKQGSGERGSRAGVHEGYPEGLEELLSWKHLMFVCRRCLTPLSGWSVETAEARQRLIREVHDGTKPKTQEMEIMHGAPLHLACTCLHHKNWATKPFSPNWTNMAWGHLPLMFPQQWSPGEEENKVLQSSRTQGSTREPLQAFTRNEKCKQCTCIPLIRPKADSIAKRPVGQPSEDDVGSVLHHDINLVLGRYRSGFE